MIEENKKCENCNNLHNGVYGSGRFCSNKCARGFSTKNKRSLINEKVSKTLTKSPYEKICEFCKNKFETKKHKNKYCSKSCASKNNWMNDEYKLNIIEIARKNAFNLHKTNTKFGWQIRKKMNPSYPESICIKFLDFHNINYEREYKIGKYFIDFVLHEYKIAIEIDGRQHNKIERIITDNIKDELLKENNWIIFRIKYPEDSIINSLTNICNKHFIKLNSRVSPHTDNV